MGGDYSKQAFEPGKHYSDVLMQQGKVQLDSDWNEQTAIQFRRKRAQTIDTIGRAVVPRETENGFKIAPDSGTGLLIHPGRMYVDGLLAENHGRLDDESGTPFPKVFDTTLDEEKTAEPVPYTSQPYLIFGSGEEVLPNTPYLVYLDVWQREVTHLKDPDIIETAVGIDTTTRMQTVWQVRTTAITSLNDPECMDALSEWESEIIPSAGRLTTDTVDVNTNPNPCQIPPGGGYRGLENRLYRVEIHEGGPLGPATFKWARHNGSVASAVTHIDGTELKVKQAQWDEFRRFEVGDWVEITDNKLEFAGESGEMAKVDKVDYATNTITLTGVLSGDFPTSGPDKDTDPIRHTRIRKWDQSGVIRDTDRNVIIDLASSSDGLIPVPASTTTVVLEDGITVTFDLETGSGEFKDADYWLFAARTEDASIELLDMAPPEGIHHHYARLAIVTGTDIEDCRIHWPPDIPDQSCCRVTVGDEINSHGDYQTIQEAVNSLPIITGGKVCILPGEYNENNILINNRNNITIEGCGERSKVISPVPTGDVADTNPIFHVTDSTSIQIAALEIQAGVSGNGVLLEEIATGSLQDIKLRDLNVQAATRSAIEVHLGSGITIEKCRINMLDHASDWPGIFLAADRALIKENSIIVTPGQGSTNAAATSLGRGGIQIGNTSEDVCVVDNLIQGGIGNGITLGSLTAVTAAGATGEEQWLGWVEDPNTGAYASVGMLQDIRIEHNRILDMGLNGIGVAAFFNLDAVDEFITVEGLNISSNEIRGCLNQTLAVIDEDMVNSMGYGGIALADVEMLSIQHNVVEDNGEARTQEPVCGIFVLHAEGAQISDNRIVDNGPRIQGESSPGPRGGIHIVYAITPLVGIALWSAKIKFPRQSGVPAITVANNIVVSPLGKALSLTALGPVSVTDNQFTSRGMISNPDSILSRISTVSILNLGISDELYLQQLMTFVAISQGMGSYDPTTALEMLGREGLDDRLLGRALASGNVLFSDNQCVCDLLGTSVFNFILSSVLIMSLDDIGFHNNQCDCNLDLISGYDLVLFPVFLLGLSVRMSGNRMKEGLLNALISAFSWGLLMNTSTSNQATHCLVIRHAVLPNRTANEHNIVFIDPTTTGLCEWFRNLAGGE